MIRNLMRHTRLPVLQAPMAGVSNPRMVIAASNSGIVGGIGCGMMQPAAISSAVEEIKAGTTSPFNVNLFVVDDLQGYDVDGDNDKLSWLYDYYSARGLDRPHPKSFAPKFDDQFEALLAAQPPIASFVFGCLDRDQVKALHDRDIAVVGAATTVEEAVKWESVNADAIVLQGIEAGGHRCSFINADDPGMPLKHLLEAVKGQVELPLIAAGGLMSGGDVREVLSYGADYAQLGTSFLTTKESPIPPPYRDSLLAAQGKDTTLTKAFSGRLARGIVNRFTTHAQDAYTAPYPVQNALTQPLRSSASANHRSDELSMWAGTGVGAVYDSPSTAEFVDRLQAEYSSCA